MDKEELTMDKTDFIKGALVGGVLGSLAALLTAPKAGKRLRDDIADGYNCVNKKSREFVENLKEQSQSLMDTIQGIEKHHSHNTFLIGGALGAVIGTIAALLLAPQSSSKLREHLGETYEHIRDKAEHAFDEFNRTRHHIEGKIDDWKDTLVTLIDKLSESKGKAKHNGSAFDDIVSWAQLGVRLYSQLQNRR
jgi:gas vesicle protein